MHGNSWLHSLGCKLERVVRISHFQLLNETHFVWLDPLTTPVNNPINIFPINLNIILYHALYIKYLKISKTSLVSIGLKSTGNILQIRLILFCFSCY